MVNFTILRENNLMETEKIIKDGALAVHPAVGKISLEGSRGLKGGFRPDSDLDISLLLKPDVDVTETLCQDAIHYSLSRWKSDTELDLAVVFDKRNCGLKCFEVQEHSPDLCEHGVDCMGIYKSQKGFSGFIENMGLDVTFMYPCLIIWNG